MGISKLGKFVDDICDVKTVPLTQVSREPTEVAVDASIFLYRFLHNSRNDSDFVMNVIEFTIKMKRLMLEPIFVLDGKSCKEKITTLNKRRQQRQNMKDQIAELQNKLDTIDSDITSESSDDSGETSINNIKQKIEKLEKKSTSVNYSHIKLFKKTLTMLGVAYIQCKEEADPVCAALVKQGITKYCLSNDNDMLAHGCNITCKNFRFINNNVTVYRLEQILERLQVNYDQFVDMCIMLGTDYNKPIFGITPAIALECIQKYNNIESILENMDKINATIVKTHRNKYGKNIRNLKRPDRKSSDSFNYEFVRTKFKENINIKESIQSTNLADLTYEWMNSHNRLINLRDFLMDVVGMNEYQAKCKVQAINLYWTSISYKRNVYYNSSCSNRTGFSHLSNSNSSYRMISYHKY
jgi:flap endonuclease-1